MAELVSPAIVAAFIAGLVSLVLVQLNFRQSRRADQLRRDERIRDFRIALRAEVRSELRNLSQYDTVSMLEEIRARYDSDPKYSVLIPRVSRHSVFEALVGEIHILPERIIDPIVLYARQRQAVESLSEDMRSSSFRQLSKEQQLAMYEDYLRMWDAWRSFATDAEKVLSE